MKCKTILGDQRKVGQNAYGEAIWYTHIGEPNGKYWRGRWNECTPQELYDECKTTMADLLRNHKDIQP